MTEVVDDKAAKIIQLVAIKNGVVLDKNDPIMILHTMNEQLIEDTRIAQNALMDEFRSELEASANRFSTEAKNHSLQIVNKTTLISEKAISELMNKQSENLMAGWEDRLKNSFENMFKLSRQASLLNLVASFITLISVIIIFVD